MPVVCYQREKYLKQSERLRLLADENVPRPLIHLLRAKDIDVKWVREIERGMSDEEVVDLSANEGRIILTLDGDFGKLVYWQKMKCVGVVLIRIRDESTRNEAVYKMLTELGSGCYNSFVVITDKKTRRRPIIRRY